MNSFKFYVMELLGLVCLFAILLPWVSYGFGSKTGLDVSRISKEILAVSAILFLFFTYLNEKWQKVEKISVYFAFFLSFILFGVYTYEALRIGYQTTLTKNLPVEMIGEATLATAKIHIGYGLLLGVGASFLIFLVNLVSLQIFRNRNRNLNQAEKNDV